MTTAQILALIAAGVAGWIALRRPSLAALTTTGGAHTVPPGAPGNVTRWRDDAVHAGTTHGVSPQLVLAVIWQESAGVETAKGSAGEIGLMQVKNVAAEDAGFNSAPWDPRSNIFVGTAYLALQIRRMGNIFDGVRAYNQGETGARRSPSAGFQYAKEVFQKAGWDLPKKSLFS